MKIIKKNQNKIMNKIKNNKIENKIVFLLIPYNQDKILLMTIFLTQIKKINLIV